MGKIKLVVSDVDGTLVVPQKHEVSEKVREAVITAENSGVKVVPVTGRPYDMVKPVLTVLGFDSFCVVDNGATICQALTGEVMWSQWLDLETVRRIVEIFLPHSSKMDYSPEWDEHTPDPETEMALVTRPAPYVFSFIPNDKVAEVSKLLNEIQDIAFHFDAHTTNPNLSATQVTHIEATKFHGVEALRKLNTTSIEETMAIGDGNNDIPLFQNAGLKIAMGNATETLKAEADHVVGTIDQDGFAEAINRFVLS